VIQKKSWFECVCTIVFTLPGPPSALSQHGPHHLPGPCWFFRARYFRGSQDFSSRNLVMVLPTHLRMHFLHAGRDLGAIPGCVWFFGSSSSLFLGAGVVPLPVRNDGPEGAANGLCYPFVAPFFFFFQMLDAGDFCLRQSHLTSKIAKKKNKNIRK